MGDDRDQGKLESVAGSIFAIVANCAFLFIVNRIPEWNLSFITEEFSKVVWILSGSAAVNIGMAFVQLFNRNVPAHRLADFVRETVSVVALATLLSVFPFDFDTLAAGWVNIVVRVVLTIGAVGAGIGAVTSFFRLLASHRQAA